MQIGFMLTDRCNISCDHCDASCGPDKTGLLPSHAIQRLMREASGVQSAKPLEICFSGGEPFLDFPRLESLVRAGQELGATVTCVSNASWASSDEKGLRLLGRLQRAGLSALAVSSSGFHQQFVPRSRVERALRIAHEFGIQAHLKLVYRRSEEDSELVDWARSLPNCRLQRIPLMPHLRKGLHPPDSEFPARNQGAEGRCPGASLSIRETGEAYMCCTPGAFTNFHSLGDATAVPLAEIQRGFDYGSVQQILRQRGPSYFLDAIRAAGHADRLREDYAGPCDLCTHIAGDPCLAGIAQGVARQKAHGQLAKVFDALASPTPVPTA